MSNVEKKGFTPADYFIILILITQLIIFGISASEKKLGSLKTSPYPGITIPSLGFAVFIFYLISLQNSLQTYLIIIITLIIGIFSVIENFSEDYEVSKIIGFIFIPAAIFLYFYRLVRIYDTFSFKNYIVKNVKKVNPVHLDDLEVISYNNENNIYYGNIKITKGATRLKAVVLTFLAILLTLIPFAWMEEGKEINGVPRKKYSPINYFYNETIVSTIFSTVVILLILALGKSGI